MSAHSVAVTVTSADMETAGLFHVRKQFPWLAVIFGIFACIGIGLAVATGGRDGPPLIWNAAAGIALAYIVIPYLAKRGFRRQYSQVFRRGGDYAIAWDDEMLNLISEYQSNRMRWSDIFAYRQVNDIVVLYWSSVSFFPIPLKSFTAEERDDFLRQFEINQVPQNPKRGRTATR